MDLQRFTPDRGNTPLVRVLAAMMIGMIAILALYFGQEVLLPAAVAIFFAFILSPAVTRLRRFLPKSVAVTAIVFLALAAAGLLSVLVMTQLTQVAGSLTGYQTNLQHKIDDIRELSSTSGPLSRFAAMIASLTQDFAAPSGAAEPVMRVRTADSSFGTLAAFILPLLHPFLTVGIVVILVFFILLDRDHISDQIVRLFGAGNVHATSDALEDAGRRVARVLSLQLLTNLSFSVVVGVGLFFLGTPNALLWGVMAGTLRFIPYVGATMGAVLPTLIAFAVSPGWLQPVLVLAWIIGCDLFMGQIVEPLIFGGSTGVTPLALILSALFWGMLWGPVGLLLSTPIAICLLVLGTHVTNLGFLQVLLGDAPALPPYQQIYRRLIRHAVAEASTVALAEIEEKGREAGLDNSLGRMVVLAEVDRAADSLSNEQIDAIVDGTDLVIDFLEDHPDDDGQPIAAAEALKPRVQCVGGRGQIDDAAAAIIAFALRQSGIEAKSRQHGEQGKPEKDAPPTIVLACYASHPSDGVRRYTSRKLRGGNSGRVRHAIIDYDVAATPTLNVVISSATDSLVGDIAALCRLTVQLVTALTDTGAPADSSTASAQL